jgi:hypothetical protein
LLKIRGERRKNQIKKDERKCTCWSELYDSHDGFESTFLKDESVNLAKTIVQRGAIALGEQYRAKRRGAYAWR